MIDNRTPLLNLPLPHPSNLMTEDVARLIEAISTLDTQVASRAQSGDLATHEGESNPHGTTAADVGALPDDQQIPASLLPSIPASNLPAATNAALGAVKIGNGLNVAPDGTLSINDSAQAFTEVTLVPSTNGQTVFSVPGGYVSGAVDLFLNGIRLVGGGDDYTATNGTSITLTVGAQTTDTLILQRWSTFQVADAVLKSSLATQAEMEAGTETAVRAMSPARIKQAIQPEVANKVVLNGALGTPSSGNVGNCTVDGTNEVGYKNIPQNSKSVAYTCVLADAGKHIYQTAAATITIPANSAVPYPIGTAITFVAGASQLSIAINTDTMRLADGGTTGTRTLAAYGVATALKVAATEWRISGAGLL